MSKYVAGGIGFFLILMWVKDGTFGGLVNDVARGVGDAGKSLKPLTKVA